MVPSGDVRGPGASRRWRRSELRLRGASWSSSDSQPPCSFHPPCHQKWTFRSTLPSQSWLVQTLPGAPGALGQSPFRAHEAGSSWTGLSPSLNLIASLNPLLQTCRQTLPKLAMLCQRLPLHELLLLPGTTPSFPPHSLGHIHLVYLVSSAEMCFCF